MSLDPSSHIQEVKALTVDIQPGPPPARAGRAPELVEDYRRRAGITAATGRAMTDPSRIRARRRALRRAARRRRPGDAVGLRGAPAADGLLHRHLDLHRLQGLRGRLQGVERGPRGRSGLDRHVARQHRAASAPTPGATSPSSSSACRVGSHEANFQRDDGDFRWLMSSDVCKHCTHAACLDVCPTGAIFRTEFGTVVVQQDICNGCGYCVPACPYGVLDKRGGRPGLQVHALLRPARRGPGAGLREGLPDRLDPVRRARRAARARRRPGRAAARGGRGGGAALRRRSRTTASAATAPSSCCSTSPRSTACRPTRS